MPDSFIAIGMNREAFSDSPDQRKTKTVQKANTALRAAITYDEERGHIGETMMGIRQELFLK
ncbi:MAG: hypothetical protein KKE17_11055 [Proteobacteria bacterium]|nr:hypothetical protein [Pseudomonadota bacterium]MBU1710531.1 hypothetical protein [Pseudomonadota bacterium]